MSYLQFSVTERGRVEGESDTAQETRILDLEPGLSLAEIARLARAFARNGVTRVRLAGGEPLLREEVVAIVETFARQPGIGLVAMTTDGVQLGKYAEPLLWAGLQRLTVSLDSLERETYGKLTGRDTLAEVLAGLEKAGELPFQYLGVTMTVRRGVNEGEVPAFIALAQRLRIGVRFAELAPEGDRARWSSQFVPAAEIRAGLAEHGVHLAAARNARALLPGGGRVEVAAPVSDPSPTRLRRLRVDALGRLTSCEWQTEEEDLRPWLGAPDLDARVAAAIDRTVTQVARRRTSSDATGEGLLPYSAA